MDRLIREWQRFRQALRSFAAFFVVVLAFACISFLSALRAWFPVTRTTSLENVSRRAENTQSSTSNEEISPRMEPQVISRTLNWQRIRQSLESYSTFAALSTTVAFFCAIFAISDAFNSIGRAACNAAFQQNSSSSTPRDESLPKLEGPMPRDESLPKLEGPTPRNESLPKLEGPTPRNESWPELEGLALRVRESFPGIQMIPSDNLKKSVPSEGDFKNVSHIRELQQSDNRSSPQKRKGEESDIEDRIRSESISSHEADQRKLTGGGRKKFRSSNEVTVDSSAKGLISVECGANLNKYSTVETSQEGNLQRSAPINVSDSCQRKSGEESCQERSLGQGLPAVFHKVNEGAGPSRQPDSVLYHENSRKQNTPTIPKESLNVPIKMQDSSDSPITHTSSSSSNIPPGGSCEIIIEAGSSQFFSDDIGQQQVEQSTEELQHELALLQESLTSIPWSYIFSSPCKPSQEGSQHQTPLTLGFPYAFSKTQIPSLTSPHESIQPRGSPYPFSRTSLHANLSKISQEGSLDESERQQESSYAAPRPREPLTPCETSPGGCRNESLRTQDLPKSPEASTNSCLDKLLPDEYQQENINEPRPSSQFRGTDISQHLVKEVTDGSQGESSQLQGSLVVNTGIHDSSKPRKISPGTSQPESMMMRSSSYVHKSPNIGFCEITTKDSWDVQNVEVSQVNTDRNTKDQSTENSKDGQYSAADKSVEERTKNHEILHSAEISRVEDSITKKAENSIENPKESAIAVNAMFPDEREEKEKEPTDHRGETNTSDKILKKGREISPSEIEVKGAFLTEKSTESLGESFGELDLADRSNISEISHGIFPISCLPQTTVSGTLQETLVLEETSTITKDNDTMFSDISYCESSEKSKVESSSEEVDGIAGESTLDSCPLEKMSKTDDYDESKDF